MHDNLRLFYVVATLIAAYQCLITQIVAPSAALTELPLSAAARVHTYAATEARATNKLPERRHARHSRHRRPQPQWKTVPRELLRCETQLPIGDSFC